MMTKSLFKALTVATLTATVALATGCANQPNKKSEIVVAPLGVPYGQNSGGYDGGDIVSNADAIRNAASSIPSTVYFGFDQSNITAESANILNQHASLLANNPSARVLVAGNTDARGSREYNIALGERRAQAVRNYLISNGANGSNIETISYGEERPAVEGNSEAAYAKNRRADLTY